MMKIYILTDAERRINSTADYIKDEFGERAEQKFKSELRDHIRLLRHNPYLGPVEPLLAKRKEMYRSIVVGTLNKVIYRIIDDHIEIVDLWDCRREPKVQTAKVNK